MNAAWSSSSLGRVASLHLHPIKPSEPLSNVQEVELVAGKGILDEPRYFGRVSSRTGLPGRRQLSLIERERIAEHAVTLGLSEIAPGAVRANVETTGVNLVALVGREVRIGEAILFFYEARMPCEKMDAVCAGLRELMLNNRQGVIAEVRRGGKVRVGDSIGI